LFWQKKSCDRYKFPFWAMNDLKNRTYKWLKPMTLNAITLSAVKRRFAITSWCDEINGCCSVWRNELDEGVAAVWHVILNGGAEWLGDAIMGFQLTPESARSAITQADESLESLAFATIIKNRVNRGGILAKVAIFIKNGKNGKGITSRWYPETLRGCLKV
jgi:hypothetical protein